MSENDIMRGVNINLATNIKWMALIPFQMIDSDLNSRNTAFNLTSYNLPTLDLTTDEVSYLGSTIEIPTGTISQPKEITFEYLLSEDFHQYIILHKWMAKIAAEIGTGSSYETLGEVMVPIRILILSAFKNPIIEVIYHNCWIKGFGDISFDYQDAAATNIKHNFTIAYTDFKIDYNPTL